MAFGEKLYPAYFINCLTKNNKFPQKVLLDIKNTNLAAMQNFMHNSEDKNSTGFVTLGPSTGKLRTEHWFALCEIKCDNC